MMTSVLRVNSVNRRWLVTEKRSHIWIIKVNITLIGPSKYIPGKSNFIKGKAGLHEYILIFVF